MGRNVFRIGRQGEHRLGGGDAGVFEQEARNLFRRRAIKVRRHDRCIVAPQADRIQADQVGEHVGVVCRHVARDHAAHGLPDGNGIFDAELAEHFLINQQQVPVGVELVDFVWVAKGGARHFRRIHGVALAQAIEKLIPVQTGSRVEINQRGAATGDLHAEVNLVVPNLDHLFAVWPFNRNLVCHLTSPRICWR